MRLKRLFVCAVLVVLPGTVQAQQRVDVALFPLNVTPARDTTLRRLADSCMTLLEGRLKSIGVTVAQRRDSIPFKDWRGFRAARLVILGDVSRVRGDFDIELKLVNVETSDELRSYLYRGPEASKIIGLGVAASERIKAVVLEHRK